ncbi:MAG TPA: hypothetical protein VNT60_07065, partial [Deinococcales bacterium]|nr:hypothetical protein [Deinococcales bacterium]
MRPSHLARLLLLITGSAALAAAPLQLRAPRVAAHPEAGYTRVVLEAPGRPGFTVTAAGKRQLTLTVKGARATAASGAPATAEIASWTLAAKGSDAVLNLSTNVDVGTVTGYKAFSLGAADGAPDRIVLDVGKAFGATAGGTAAPARTASKAAAPAPAPKPATATKVSVAPAAHAP